VSRLHQIRLWLKRVVRGRHVLGDRPSSSLLSNSMKAKRRPNGWSART